METILAKGIDAATGEYDLPDICSEKVLIQVKIIASKQESLSQPPLKVLKTDQMVTATGSTKNDYKPSLSIQSAFPRSPTVPPKDSKSSVPSTSSPSSSALQKKQDAKDFFKERSKEFKAKNPDEMQASSPPARSTNHILTNDKKIEEAMRALLPVILPKGRMAEKLKDASPYNFFLTTVTASPETHSDPLSVTFLELLDPSLGELESSVQFNFLVDAGWLLAQYAFAKYTNLPLLILYGSDDPTLVDINKKRPNVTAIKVNIPTPIGVHHTKMMLLFYKDKSMRVVVSTANLYEDDWDNRVQGLWISERLPALDDGVSYTTHGESCTGFRSDLMRYLIAYNIPKLQPIVAKIRETDFSSVKVFFVSSVPGTHQDSGKGIYFGHPRIASLLSKHSAPIDDSNPIIMQASSIGSLGSSAPAYLTGEIASSFKRDSAPVGLRRVPNVKFIYPSLSNVLSSHDEMAGGGCLPYNGSTHDKQRWLNEHLYQWKAASRKRNRAMPHIKSYCRYSDRGLYWFILTSANLSKSAWGVLNKSNKTLNPSLRVNSYEAGVVFFPRLLIDKERFPMNATQQKDGTPIFKLPFDVPLVPYGKDDVPYCAEYLKAYLEKYGAK